MSWAIPLLHALCTFVGGLVLIVGALCLIANRLCWLWTCFLEAAGRAYYKKQRRDAEHARYADVKKQMHAAAVAAAGRLAADAS